MGWNCRRHLNLLGLLGVLLSNTVAGAYPTPVDFSGKLLRWNLNMTAPIVTYEIVADNARQVDVWQPTIEAAAAMWSSIPGSYATYAPASPGTTPMVSIHLKSALDGAPYSAGYTIFDQYEGNDPAHCSIFVLIDVNVTATDMAKTFLHEMGHALGLGHSLIPHAIMSYNLAQNEFSLDVDDEAAIARLYPANGSRPRLPPGCAIGSFPKTPQGHWTEYLILLVIFAPVLLASTGRWWRLKRRLSQ